MNILIYYPGLLPAFKYGGIERVVWSLGRALVRRGHRVVFLAARGSRCDFAPLLHYNSARTLEEQIPADTDIAHLHSLPDGPLNFPWLYTMHGNASDPEPRPVNSVFLCRNHAERHGAEAFVYNGLDWEEYSKPDLNRPRGYFHFLGNAAWRVKNVRGAIRTVTSLPGERLVVLGGRRLNVKMGFRLTLSPRVSFKGMVGGAEKFRWLGGSKGLVFPVRWHEPFGLAVTESLYYGAPVFATPYGSLPELVTAETGFLSANREELARAMTEGDFSPVRCHEYARELFNADRMAESYLACYEKVLRGESLNSRAPVLQQFPAPKFLPWEE